MTFLELRKDMGYLVVNRTRSFYPNFLFVEFTPSPTMNCCNYLEMHLQPHFIR